MPAGYKRHPPLKISIFADPPLPDRTLRTGPLPVERFLNHMQGQFKNRHLAIHTLSLHDVDTEILHTIGREHVGRISVHQLATASNTFPLEWSIGKLSISQPRPIVNTVREAVQNAVDATSLVVLFPASPFGIQAEQDTPTGLVSLTTRALRYAKTTRKATMVVPPDNSNILLLFTDNLARSIRPPSSLFYGRRHR